MDDTGRIKRTLRPTLRKLLFGATADGAIEAEMDFGCEVDRAHVLMLARRGLIGGDAAAALLREIEALAHSDYEALRGRHAPRGLYLLYEDHLIERAGAEAGGFLQLGRSRNDRAATILRMRLRAPFARLCLEGLRLVGELCRRADEHAEVVMPAYTHYQPAVPITYGHYLAGLAHAFERDLAGLFAAAGELARSPLGAGAVGGTTVPIDPELSAALLGFEGPVPNSIDAVASRDLALRLCAAAAILGVTLSRAATDLLFWTTQELAFLSLPDELVGSSSMMPQKRNVYVLEHVQGRSAAALGAFTAAAAAMRGTPFTNTIASGTEGVSHVWAALERTAECAMILRRIFAEARPEPEAMLARAREGWTQATALAERLALEEGVPFRSAHRQVGEALASGAAASGLPPLDPSAVVTLSEHGGGPGPHAIARSLTALRARTRDHARALRAMRRRWRAAACELDRAARELVGAR